MSYDIVYDSFAIKSRSGYTICLLCGSNNVWEQSLLSKKQKRARDWSIWNNLLGFSGEAITKKFAASCGGVYQEHFKKNGKWIDDAALMRLINNMLKHAMTLEEAIQANGINGGVEAFCYFSKQSAYNQFHVFLKSTEELDNWIGEVKQYVNENASNGDYLLTSIRWNFNNMPIKKATKGVKDVVGPVVLKYKQKYVCEITQTSMSCCPNYKEALEFPDMKTAIDSVPNCWKSDVRAVSATAIKEKNYVIRVTNNLNTFYRKRSSRHIYQSYSLESAAHYRTEKEAQKVVDTINPLVKNIKWEVCSVSEYETDISERNSA